MGYFANLWAAFRGSPIERTQYLPLPPVGRLDAQRFYYENNATYDRLTELLQGQTGAPVLKGIKPLENPAHKVVEFYASKLLPRELEDGLESPTEAVKTSIEQVRKWSNWGQRSRVASRWLSMYGNLFIKVASSPDATRVFRQLIDPRYVTYFEKDERDFFTFLRLDIPQERTNTEGEIEPYYHAEIWNKEKQTYEVYEHALSAESSLEEVQAEGKRIVSQKLTVEGDAVPEAVGDDGKDPKPPPVTGFNFIPVVHVKFRDTGEDMGASSFGHTLEAIDDLNLSLTKLTNMLFPDQHLVLKANAVTRDGVPMDAPQLEALASTTPTDENAVRLAGMKFWRLPGNSELESVVPAIDFGSHIEAINSANSRIEKLLPELSYYRLRDMQEISGRAVRLLLGDVIDRVEEARENITSGLVRANEMAMTIGKAIGNDTFDGIGEFEDGAMEHNYPEVEVFPISQLEEQETEKSKVETATKLIAAGVIDPTEARAILGLSAQPAPGQAGENGTPPATPPNAPVEGDGAARTGTRQLLDRIGVGGGSANVPTP